jgi:CRP/FNR family cyclic AMP-dependent transcriptional regulator
MGPAPKPLDTCRLLDEDPELAESLPTLRRERAAEELVTPCMSFPAGPLALPQFDPPGLGLVVLKGVLLRHLSIDGRLGLELVGESDLLRPWQGADAPATPVEDEWSVLLPTRVAWLDERCASVLPRYPELMDKLLERAVRRSRHLVTNLAIVHQPRVDTRLRLLLWHLAGRWGRVRPDGVFLPLKLTHSLLADLVAARRPTVTSALSDLSRRGILRQVGDGWLLLGDPPRAVVAEPASIAGTSW